MAASDAPLNALAQALNEEIAAVAPEVLEMLSGLGRSLFFPKGILTQSAEARAEGHRFNATIGIATEGKQPMQLPVVGRMLEGMSPSDTIDYAPSAGRPGLRARWREKLLRENPSLLGKAFGEPVVTHAITHGLNLAAEMFVDAGDVLVLPDKLWGNYRLTFGLRRGAQIASFPFYRGDGFDCESFDRVLAEQAEQRDKLVVLLNFPNNPTGYMPTPAEASGIVDALVARAERGTKLVVLLDDAYFGLFYHLGGESITESLFGLLANRHPNLLAVKLDGATKELFVWGLRCGFISIAPGRREGAEVVCNALEAKLKGAIRSGISNVSMLSQTLVERALESDGIDAERAEKAEILRARAARVFEVANAPRFRESFETYPFNSGYFMCVRVEGVDAETLRRHLLEKYGTGLIATTGTDIRIAFSCLEIEDVEPLFETLHKAIQELRSAEG